MAITKIHPIKTTLNLSIDYICDTTKTDEQILISSYKCGYQTAAFQFANTKKVVSSSAKNLARHLIQSFMPGEVTAETAHQIGIELCKKHLKGNYEYVLTTHVDKGHIHNHIIFNNVSFVDGKAYISNRKSYHDIRNTSDHICKENNLSIATDATKEKKQYKTKGKSYKEYQERRHGNSYKAKLQYAIDRAVKQAKDWEDFLRLIQLNGYEIKYGKHIAFKLTGQERFTRAKTIGEDYTEERIKERIANRAKSKNYYTHKTFSKSNSNNNIVNISTNKLAMESEGFARWLKLQNLKNMAKSWNDISDSGATDVEAFYKKVNTVHDELSKIQSQIKVIECKIQDTKEKIRNITIYKKYKTIYNRYQKANNKDAFFRMHEKEIILFEAARESLKKPTTYDLLNSIDESKKYYLTLSSDLEKLKIEFSKQKNKVSEINSLRTNLETYLKSNINLNEHQH